MPSFEETANKLKDPAFEAVVAAFTDTQKLDVYALFKQGSVGDVNIERPGMFDLRGKAKWDAWNAKKGLSQDDAKNAYVALVEGLIA